VAGHLAGAALLLLLGVGADGPASPEAYPRPGPGLNLLAREASPYLQLHAHNPVDWYPWGEAALDRARRERKPIFLSIGYSTCYWCHVMEREVFSDPAIAALMNRDFIAIKVDREERPDLDDVYMKATHVLTGSGGWPNSLFLTPDGRPFFAGTYFPPTDERGRPGFPRVLRAMHDAWVDRPVKVISTADAVMQQLDALGDPGAGQTMLPPPPEVAMRQALAGLRGDFDPVHGGFGPRTRFPRPPALELLLTRLEQGPDPDAMAMLTKTLDEIALGGISDQLGGGFHRYATEPTWSIPHFEKMLYDNAQLLGVYARAYALTGRPLYRRVVERTADYLDREMSQGEGGFASAQDAEVGGYEGASYLWRRAEIEAVLGRQRAAAFLSVYALAPTPEDPSRGVLRVQRGAAEGRGLAARLAGFDAERRLLLARRDRREQPRRDDKVLAAWNGLAIRGWVQAASALGRPAYLRRAERAADFVRARLLADDGTLRRSYIAGQAREQGILDDYAMLADGLLSLWEATGRQDRLVQARQLADRLLDEFEDPVGGGFFLTPKGSTLLFRPKPFEDNALPSGNAVALRVLRRLAGATGSARYRDAAARSAAAAALYLRRAPSVVPATIAALTGTGGPSSARQAGAEASAYGAAPEPFRLPRSKDHVHATLAADAADPGARVVRVVIDPGWHVNANPASLPFLVPTSVERADGSAPAGVRYPEGRLFHPAFSTDGIQVYEGGFEFGLPRGRGGTADGSATLALRFQACDQQRCLPPDRVEIAAPVPSLQSPMSP